MGVRAGLQVSLRASLLVVYLLTILNGGCRKKLASPQIAAKPTIPRVLFTPHLFFWSFDARDPVVDIGGYKMSFQLFTKEDYNTYGLAAGRTELKQEGNRWTLHAGELAWAGQQQRAPGTLDVTADLEGDLVLLHITATAQMMLRGVKVLIRGLPGSHVGLPYEFALQPMKREHVYSPYPDYRGGMPVWFLGGDHGKGIAFASSDLEPRRKRFVAYPDQIGEGITAELIFEEDARRWGPKLTAPVWEISRNTTFQAAMERRLAVLEAEAGLKKWEERTDVPAWAKDIALVMTIHGAHWSGYVFNDYAKTLETVRWVTQRIDGKRVMVFLAGWEGRYYWQYGDYRPEPRMGGPEGFKKMIDGIHQTGAHVMLMFGGNAVNATFPNYRSYGPESGFDSPSSPVSFFCYPYEWDGSRSNLNALRFLNPGAPAFQNHLVGQIQSLLDRYGFDGVYLDTQPGGSNDVRYNEFEGLGQICLRLRTRHPNLLLASESWFDLSLPFIPVSITWGGADNWAHRYGRRFAHIAWGEPSRGSSGVHELGYVDYNLPELLATYDWPTVSFVDTTLKEAPEKVQAVIDQARIYAQKNLK